MAMAAMGDPKKYVADFRLMLRDHIVHASMKPSSQPRGALIPGRDPVHPYLDKYLQIAMSSEQEKFDLAAGLQAATEDLVKQIIGHHLWKNDDIEHICIAGGVALNSVCMGKVRDWFPKIKSLYIPPVPYDGGLCIGGAQYVWHHVLENERVKWQDNMSPYLGEKYGEERIRSDLSKFADKVIISSANDLDVANLLDKQNIVAVFQGGSESGRRALGARSILADPRSDEMKGRVNEKVKHRQWFRPFAPSILRESVGEFFVRDEESPYMGIVLKFRDEAKSRVPAVVHYDGTARLQTVTADSGWYYNFITTWNEVSGVPVVLNTSFNDREPICETPEHAISCFLGTDIDFLYFPEHGILVRRSE
jgi:carbamoyltransferase